MVNRKFSTKSLSEDQEENSEHSKDSVLDLNMDNISGLDFVVNQDIKITSTPKVDKTNCTTSTHGIEKKEFEETKCLQENNYVMFKVKGNFAI